MLGERDALRAQAGEHEAAIARLSRYAREAMRALVEPGVAAGIGRAEQLAGEVVGPAVVRTRERARAPAVGRAHHRAAMHATVGEDRDLALARAHHQDGLGADAAGDEIAGARDLALVADEDPAAVEDAFHLVVEDARVGVERRVDAVVLHE